jgi:hypothetical protein
MPRRSGNALAQSYFYGLATPWSRKTLKISAEGRTHGAKLCRRPDFVKKPSGFIRLMLRLPRRQAPQRKQERSAIVVMGSP